jgi:lipid-A-disaccharide synthase
VSLLYLVAGEASGDILGARLMQAIAARDPAWNFAGIGGERMQAAGLGPSLFPMRELSLMGLAEVLPRVRSILRRLDETVTDIEARRPAAVVTIDAPGFTLRLAKRVRALGIPVIHYVAPQVWAWRQGRARKLAAKVDHLMCLLPFEPKFFAPYGLDARFVGHPVLESGMDAGNAARFRAQHGIDANATVLAVLPGSRGGEVTRHLPIFLETLRRVARPGLVLAVPTLPAVAAQVRAAAWPVPAVFVAPEDRADAFAASTAALCKSGTATLEVALAGVPMLVAYRVNPITAAIAKRLIKVRFASLVNLLADRAIAPEFIQHDCTPDLLAPALATLLDNPAAREAQRDGFRASLAQLAGPGGVAPSQAAASCVLGWLKPA